MNENEILEDLESLTSGDISLSFFEKLGQKFLDFLPTLLSALVIFIVGLIIDKIVIKLLKGLLNKSRIDRTVHGFIRSLAHILMMILTFIITLSILGIPMTSIIAVISAAGLAIGLALQNSLSNVAGGFVILLSKPFKVGEYISINGVEGTVKEITMAATEITTLDNKAVFMPNGSVASSTVINYTREPFRRVDLVFSVAYEEDFRRAEKIIADVASKHEKILKTPPPQIRVLELAESSVNITARVWVKCADYWDVYFDLNEQVKTAFDSEMIVIPFNQLDVHNV